MKKIIFYLFLLWSITLSAQVTENQRHKTTVVFSSDTNISIRVNDPIDNAENFVVTTNKFNVEPHKPVTHELNINGFSTLDCRYSNGWGFKLLILENNQMEVSFEKNRIIVKGDNATGNQYMIDNYCSKGLGYYDGNIERIINKHHKGEIDIKSIDKEIQDSVLSVYKSDMLKMQQDKKISDDFAFVMNNNLNNAYADLQIGDYCDFFGKRAKQKLTATDSVMVVAKMDDLYKNSLTLKNPECYDYDFPYTSYYTFKYKYLNDSVKKQLFGENNEDTFGSKAYYLLAPDSLQQVLLGQSVVEVLMNRYNSFDYNLMQAYYCKKFPKSEYVPIINNLMTKNTESLQAKSDSLQYTFIDSKSINSVKDLIENKYLKGKKLFIDLWSVYCMPCKIQFQYLDELHKLLNKYDNVASLYLTIDDEKEEDRWRKDIAYYHLQGYHLMANKSLYNDFSKVFYNGGPCYEPRYILLDENGKILNNNLPRPQQTDQLRKTLDNLLKAKNK